MNKIPEDIRLAAESVVDRGYNEGLLDAIARAILAERKRCAEVAQTAVDDFYGNPEMRNAAAVIASRIEAGA